MPSLDIEDSDQLFAYLVAGGHVSPAERVTMTNLAGGVSNRTVLVERENGPSWVLKQALAKLRVRVDWFSDPSRIHHEALGLRWLRRYAPEGSIPDFIFEDEREHVLAMEAVAQPHDNWKSLLLGGRVEPDHVRQFAGILASIHRRSAANRDTVEPMFADTTFFETLRLEPYYLYTAQQVPESRPFFDALIADTRANRTALVHGDYSPKNVLVHQGKLILLDYEVIHFGDPAFDLGFSLTHLLSKAHHIAHQRQHFAEAANAYWTTYRAALGSVAWSDGLEARAVRHTIGCLLARVEGRSPLEYLTPVEREAQRASALGLSYAPPRTVSELTHAFIERINGDAGH